MRGFNFGGDGDVRDRQDRKDKRLHRADEEAEPRPGGAWQPGKPGWHQRDDQAEQQLADEDVEVKPERQRDRLRQLVDHGQREVRRDQEEVLEEAAKSSLLDTEKKQQDEGLQGQGEVCIPVIGWGLEAGDQPNPVAYQQKEEERNGERTKGNVSALQGLGGETTDVLDDGLDNILSPRWPADAKLSAQPRGAHDQDAADDQAVAQGVDIEVEPTDVDGWVLDFDGEPLQRDHALAGPGERISHQPATAAAIGKQP